MESHSQRKDESLKVRGAPVSLFGVWLHLLLPFTSVWTCHSKPKEKVNTKSTPTKCSKCDIIHWSCRMNHDCWGTQICPHVMSQMRFELLSYIIDNYFLQLKQKFSFLWESRRLTEALLSRVEWPCRKILSMHKLLTNSNRGPIEDKRLKIVLGSLWGHQSMRACSLPIKSFSHLPRGQCMGFFATWTVGVGLVDSHQSHNLQPLATWNLVSLAYIVGQLQWILGTIHGIWCNLHT